MPPHPNFELRGNDDHEAANIACVAIVAALIEEMEVELDRGRIRDLVGEAAGDDMNLIARAQWFVGWMLGDRG